MFLFDISVVFQYGQFQFFNFSGHLVKSAQLNHFSYIVESVTTVRRFINTLLSSNKK